MDLTGWTYVLTYGYNGDVYAKGKKRVMIDRKTGEPVICYKGSDFTKRTSKGSKEREAGRVAGAE